MRIIIMVEKGGSPRSAPACRAAFCALLVALELVWPACDSAGPSGADGSSEDVPADSADDPNDAPTDALDSLDGPTDARVDAVDAPTDSADAFDASRDLDGDAAEVGEPDGGPPSPTLIEQLDEIDDLDQEGRPILIRSPAVMPSGLELALVYDATLDDPITRWAACLAIVRDCLPPWSAAPDSCVEALPACADDTGGEACCAPSCVTAFADARDAGADVDAAWEASFLDGRCVDGLAELVELPPLEVAP